LILFGPPGSGKGTIGKSLATLFNHFHLSSGEVFRSLSPDSPAGQLFQRYANQGLLLPDEATTTILFAYIEGLIATNRFFPGRQLLILDGIPRTPTQKILIQDAINLLRVIVLEMPSEERLIARLKNRALLERRYDDGDETVYRTRMEIYKRETAKVLESYPSDLITLINADQKPAAVFRDLLVDLAEIL
jgi:adenylate kinase